MADERISFYAIRPKQGEETEDQVLVFGAVQFEVGSLPEWDKYASGGSSPDPKKFENLVRIARKFNFNKTEEKWEFWIARTVSISALQGWIESGKKTEILWNPIFKEDPFNTNFSKPIVDEYIPSEYSVIENGQIIKRADFTAYNRIVFLHSQGLNYHINLDLITANPTNPEETLYYRNYNPKNPSFIIKKHHALEDTRSRDISLPFLHTIKIKPVVRMVLNNHEKAAVSHSHSNAAIFFKAGRFSPSENYGGKARTLFEPDNLMGFDHIELGITKNEREIYSPVTAKRNGTDHVTFLGISMGMGEQEEELSEDNCVGEIKKPDAKYGVDAKDYYAKTKVSRKPQNTAGFKALSIHVDEKTTDTILGCGLRSRGYEKGTPPPVLLLRFETVLHIIKGSLPGNISDSVDFSHGSNEKVIITQEQPESISSSLEESLIIPSFLDWKITLSAFDNELIPFKNSTSGKSAIEFGQGWNRYLAEPILQGLNQIQDGRNLSTIVQMELQGDNKRLNFGLYGHLQDNNPTQRAIPLAEDLTELAGTFYYYLPLRCTLSLGFFVSQSRVAITQPPTFSCTLSAFRNHRGEEIKVQAVLELPDRITPNDTEEEFSSLYSHFQLDIKHVRDTKPGFRFQLRMSKPEASGDGDIVENKGENEDAPQKVRLGAYDFDILPKAPVADSNLVLADCLLIFENGRTRHPSISSNIPRLEWRSNLAASAIAQEAEDELDDATAQYGDDRQTRSLVDPEDQLNVTSLFIPLKKQQFSKDDYLILAFEERIGEQFSHSFKLNLLAHKSHAAQSDNQINVRKNEPKWNGGAPKEGVIYVSQKPFFVAIAQPYNFFSTIKSGGDSIVARWDDIGLFGRWLVKIPDQKSALFLPPQAVGESMEKGVSPSIEDFAKDERADFRFSPVTKIEYDPSPIDTEFGESPLNMKRLFGETAGFRSGVGVYSISFELLYGMGIHFEHESFLTSEASIRIANRSALDGRPAPFLGLNKPYHKYWQSIRSALASEVSVLDLWSPFQRNIYHHEEGVTFKLRKNADLKHPVTGYIKDERRDRHLPFHEKGLAGGVSWPFESANIVRKVWKYPLSNTAELSRVRISARGGYGHQKGSFDDKLTTIETETSLGRIHRYKLERIGRIACLWNKAKHVIIYERSTVPSPQFVNEDAKIGITQNLHNGRPVLRKIEEFIEILQPLRRFDGEDATANTGFTKAAIFRSVKIRVDSRWGRDVKKGTVEGWEVPLWRKELGAPPAFVGFNPFPVSSLYPKPQIDLLMVTADGQEKPIEINQPEKLRFFTATKLNENNYDVDENTDQWPSLVSVDYPDAPSPSIPSADEYPLPLTDSELPSANPVAPGWDRFTLGLSSSGERIAVGHGRTKEAGPTSRLSNISLARSKPLLNEAVDGLDNFSRNVIKATQGVDLVIDQFEGLLANLDPRKIDDAAMNLEDELRRRFKEFEDKKGKLEGIFKDAKAKAEEAEGQVGALLKTCEVTPASAGNPATIPSDNPIFMEITRVLGLGEKRFLRELKIVEKLITDKVDDVVRELDQILKNTKLDVDSKKNTAIAYLKEAKATIDSLSRQASVRIDSAISGNLGTLSSMDYPNEVKEKVLEFIGKVETEYQKVKIVFLTKTAKIKTDIDDLISHIEGATDQILLKIKTARNKLSELNQTFGTEISAIFKLIKLKIAELKKSTNAALFDVVERFCINVFPVATIKSRLEDLKNKLPSNISEITGYSELEELEKKFEGTKQEIQTVFNDFKNEWDKEKEAFNSAKKEALEGLEIVRTKVADFSDTVVDASQKSSKALRLIQAIGNPPDTGGLDMNRKEVAFVIGAADDLGVDMTPVIARVNRGINTVKAAENAAYAVEDALETFGVALPMRKMVDEFTPDNVLKDFDISRIMPDMGGLKLGGLFKDFKFPDFGEDLKKAVSITHSFDAQTRSAKLDATIDVPMRGKPDDPMGKKSAEILALGPVKFDLKNGAFNAEAHVNARLGQDPITTSKGAIKGDFALEVSGLKIITFKETSLTFDDKGNTKFNVQPEKIELDAALEFLIQILRDVSARSGFLIEPIEKNGQTAGISAILNLELPDLSAGAFAINDLVFNSALEIVFRPEFAVGVNLSLGRRTSPFKLTVSFLTGGGYFISRTLYNPSQKLLSQEIAISAAAGAGAGFNFGVAEGHISLLVGIEVTFFWRDGGSQSLSIALYVLGEGGCTVLGLIHVNLSLRLEVRYIDNGLLASGSFRATVRISRFFKKSISENVSYQLTGSSHDTESNDNYSEAYG